MKALIAAAKTALQTALTTVRSGDVYVTEDLGLIRASGGYPAVALKDGGTEYATEAGNQRGDTLTLKVGIYVKLHKPEASIMGDDSASELGLLDLAAAVIAALDSNLSGTVDLAEPVNVSESRLLFDEVRSLQAIDVTMRFYRWQ